MKKSLLIVASLALVTAAWAQTDPSATQTPAEQGSTPSEASQSPGAQAMPSTPDSAGGMQAPAGSDMSGGQGATPPAGGDMSGGQGMGQGAMSSGGAGNMAAAQQTASSTDTSNYPKCSKSVTDKCVSAGGTGAHKATHRRAMRHKKPA